VTTDADCQFHHEWLSSINAFYQDQQSRFIAAPVRFTYQDNWIERLQALDFMILQGITGASVSSRFHDMCNGANLAYTRKSFEKVNGFAGVDHLASGDDMFLMHKVAKLYPDRVHYLKSKEAIVTTRPMTTWKALLQQRRRWASKTFAYTDRKLIATLGFVYVFNLWFLILLAAGFLQPVFFLYALCFILVKTLIEWPFVRSVSQFFGEEKLLRWFPFFQPVHIIYTILVGVLSQWGRYEWKGRTTK
jgi:cellulose synthase/poly-beta-1,6-N-acetylglucosamine synthase-like glycosyltransferase